MIDYFPTSETISSLSCSACVHIGNWTFNDLLVQISGWICIVYLSNGLLYRVLALVPYLEYHCFHQDCIFWTLQIIFLHTKNRLKLWQTYIPWKQPVKNMWLLVVVFFLPQPFQRYLRLVFCLSDFRDIEVFLQSLCQGWQGEKADERTYLKWKSLREFLQTWL